MNPDNEKQQRLEQLEKERIEAEAAFNRSQEMLGKEGNGFIGKEFIDTLNKRRKILLDLQQKIKEEQEK